MTRTTNARIAGAAYLAYIAAAFPSMVLFSRAASGDGVAAKLASIARHAPQLRVSIVLSVAGCFCALALAVTLYAITRDEDPELALLALTCRVAEGVVGAIGTLASVSLLWLATKGPAAGVDTAAGHAIGAYLLGAGDGATVFSATFFAAGSTLFSWLLLRGRIVSVPLAWLGVIASALLVVAFPLRFAGWLTVSIAAPLWIAMLVFEVLLALWLLIKGAAVPRRVSRIGEGS
jgi:hypothetical protein